ALFVSDLDRIAAFYADVIGLSEARRSNDHIVLESPGYQLVIHRAFGDEPATSPAVAPANRRSGAAFKTVFVVPNLAGARTLVESSGGVLDPVDREWSFDGAAVCDAVDPEGNVVQLRTPAL